MKLIHNYKMLPIILIWMCIFASNNAARESVAHGLVNSDNKLILDIIKRLGDPSYNYQPEGQGESTGVSPGKQQESASNELQTLQISCEPIIQEGSIIKSTESISAGAVYIDSVKNVKTNADCLEFCCQNSTCDVAVYQDKGDRYCYLFNCAGRCIFKPHSGYFVGTIKGRKSSEHPEEDLQSLNSEVTGSGNEEKKTATADEAQKIPEKQETVPPISEQTTPKIVATTQTESPELVITPHSVGLGGFCTQDRHCEDPNAVCGRGNCVCKDSYYNKEGICRIVCLTSEFECFELGTLSRGPECILRSQVCDSYLHCADGSDEFNCENIAPNNQQNNWSQQSGPALSSFKGNHKSSSSADPFTQTVVQEPANDSNQVNAVPQAANPQPHFQSPVIKEHEMSSNQQFNRPLLQNYDVRPKPAVTNKEGSMRLSQNLYSGNDQPQSLVPNPYPNKSNVENRPANSDFRAAHVTNTNNNSARKGPLNPEPSNTLSLPQNANSASSQQVDDLRQVSSVKLDSNGNSNAPAEFSPPSQTYQTGPQQGSDMNDSGQNLHQQSIQESPHHAGYSDGGQNPQYSSQFMGSPAMRSQPHPQTPQDSSQEGGLRPSSRLHPEDQQNSVNSLSQKSQHVDQSFLPSQKSSSSLKSSKLTNSHSQSSGNGSGKSRSKIQSSSKSHASAFDQSSSKSQNRMSKPSYSNSQKWLDPSLYTPYSIGDSSQQEQPQAPVESHYFDSPQYYPPYSSDNLDTMPESLLENTGSNDEFSQFGGPDIGHGKSFGLPYSSQNSGYQRYPDTSYGGQYPPSIRYEDSGDYRPPAYQDPDIYSLGRQRAYRPSAGLYEDFPSEMRPSKSSNLNKGQDKVSQSSSGGQKNGDAANSVYVEHAHAVKPISHPTRLPAAATASNKNKTDSAPSPSPPAHKQPPPPESHSEKKHIFMSSEKVIIANASDAEGPIIALSLGLAFTVILLVLVGCRLRNVRHRLRKGRPLHQNEADYLINGMYL